mmetsp:Transcript_67202/g.193227  ORF Transcript_67202/g.193227 Transcript_67202/m.193227 type:complete len:247 (-) Transcript_67202:709-1449(-)
MQRQQTPLRQPPSEPSERLLRQTAPARSSVIFFLHWWQRQHLGSHFPATLSLASPPAAPPAPAPADGGASATGAAARAAATFSAFASLAFFGFGSSLLSVGFGSSLCFGAFVSSFFKSFGSFGCAKASAVAGKAFFFFSFLPSFSAFCPSGPATGQLFPRFCNISCIFFASATGVADIGAGAGAATTAAAGVATGSGSAAAVANDSISGASSFDASAFVVFTSTVFFVEAFAESSTSSSTMPTFAT